MARQPVPAPTSSPAALSRFLLLATISVIVLAMKFAQEVFVPIALAVLLTFVLAPLVMRLERYRIGRVASVIISITAAIALIVGIGAIVFIQAQQLANDLPTYQDNIVAKLEMFRPTGKKGVVGKIVDTAQIVSKKVSTPATTQASSQPATQPATTAGAAIVPTMADSFSAAAPATTNDAASETVKIEKAEATPLGSKKNPSYVIISESGGIQWETIEAAAGPILGPLGTAGIVIVFTIFMLLAREDLRDRLIRLAGNGRLTVTTQAISDAGDRISRYLLMQLIINGSYGTIIALGLWIIGVPNPLLFGLLCSVLRFLPYVGPLIAMSFPIIVSFGKFSGFAKVGETVALFGVVELFCNNVMEPWLYGSSTGMSTIAILVAAVFWTWLWGPVGLLLSTPLTVILVVMGKYVPQLSFLDVLLGDRAVLEPHERFYQRLLALDSEEATELAREFREKESLEHVYNSILLPALGLAERDRHGGLLEPDRELFLRTSIREVIDELGDEERADLTKQAAARAEREAKGLAAPAAPKTKPDTLVTPGIGKEPRGPRLPLPKDCRVNVICLPAQEEADELANLMLSQLLEFGGYCAVSVSSTKLASERVEAFELEKGDLAVISALPPSAIAKSRYLLKRLAPKVRDERLLVALWLNAADPKRSKERLNPTGAIRVTTTITDALDQIHQMAQPVLMENKKSETK